MPKDYRVICDRTGKKLWRSQVKYEWDGLLVWERVWDPRPEYLIPPNTMEIIAVPDARPDPPNIFTVPDPNNIPYQPNS